MPRNLCHRLEHSRVLDTAANELPLDHALPFILTAHGH
jgi:hypothetical protein